MSMSECSIDERPYEKFEKYGVVALTNTDLLAIILRTGTKDYNVERLASRLLFYGRTDKKEGSLSGLYQLSYEELQQIKGIGKIKALQIVALLELSKRIAKEKNYPTEKIDSPDEVAHYFMEELRHLKEEQFVVTFLDAKCKITGYQMVSKGSLTASIVHPREVYKLAIQKAAHSIIVLHNHPSGDPTPSREDIEITKRLKSVGELIGIPLLDHIIIGDRDYKSLRKESYI